jgi:hypothetical protein
MARIYKSKFRVPSDEVQGEGSWVDFQRPTWGMIGELPADDRSGKRLLELAIVGWNWTDDDGAPLPLPRDNPGMVDTLPQPEAQWLMENSGIVEKREALKNLSSTSSPT